MSRRFDSCSGHKRRPAHEGQGHKQKSKNKVMKKKFIQKNDLGDILESIAEKAIEISKDFDTEIVFRKLGDDVVMDVIVKSARASRAFETMAEQTYDIIDNLSDDMDVIDETISAAKAKAEKQNEEES